LLLWQNHIFLAKNILLSEQFDTGMNIKITIEHFVILAITFSKGSVYFAARMAAAKCLVERK